MKLESTKNSSNAMDLSIFPPNRPSNLYQQKTKHHSYYKYTKKTTATGGVT
jgi:hypothetical protein